MTIFTPNHQHYTYEGVRFTFRDKILARDIAAIAALRTVPVERDWMFQEYESCMVRTLMEEIHVHETDTHYYKDSITDELWGEIPYEVIEAIVQMIHSASPPLPKRNEQQKQNSDTDDA